jgi:SAM-dependent methyltransferase
MQKTSEEFYSRHAQRYAEVSHGFIQSIYNNVSHPGLTGDLDLIARMKELIPQGSRGLDAGCGAGARDVFFYWREGYDIVGVDAVEENIRVARELHPEISPRVSVADLSKPLDYSDADFDFALCNAVIQHIPAELVTGVTLPELARVLKTGGVLQLMFKVGSGTKTLYDKDYGSERSFQLYGAEEIVAVLSKLGLEVVPQEGDKLGGVMYFTDPKPADHCVFYARKTR